MWAKLHETLLSRLHGAEGLDWSRACADSASVRAVGGEEKTGPNPTDRGKPGNKHHVLTAANGPPCGHADQSQSPRRNSVAAPT